jgi:hypothetical protein
MMLYFENCSLWLFWVGAIIFGVVALRGEKFFKVEIINNNKYRIIK